MASLLMLSKHNHDRLHSNRNDPHVKVLLPFRRQAGNSSQPLCGWLLKRLAENPVDPQG